MHHGKHQILVIIAAALGVVAACKTTEVSPVARVTLRMGSQARVASDVTVQVDSILDSRCPREVVCIWAGEAKVWARVQAGSETRPILLSLNKTTGKDRTDSTAQVVGSSTYSIVLRNVTPFPTAQATGLRPTSEAVLDVKKI